MCAGAARVAAVRAREKAGQTAQFLLHGQHRLASETLFGLDAKFPEVESLLELFRRSAPFAGAGESATLQDTRGDGRFPQVSLNGFRELIEYCNGLGESRCSVTRSSGRRRLC